MVVAERELFPALVLEIEDELRVLAVFSREDVLPLKHGRVELRAAVQHETLLYGPLDVVAAEHLSGTIVARALVRARGEGGERSGSMSMSRTGLLGLAS